MLMLAQFIKLLLHLAERNQQIGELKCLEVAVFNEGWDSEGLFYATFDTSSLGKSTLFHG
jgi:hypothetical protein